MTRLNELFVLYSRTENRTGNSMFLLPFYLLVNIRLLFEYAVFIP